MARSMNCGAAQVTCEADGNCSEYEASGAVPQQPCSTTPPPVTTRTQQPTASQQKPPDLNMVFKDPFFFFKRTDNMDIVTYVNKVEINFLEKLEEIDVSEFYLALFWIVNAQWNNTDFSILYNGLDFEKAMNDKDVVKLKDLFDKDPNVIEDQNDLRKDTTVFKINKDLPLIAKNRTYITEVYESNEQISDSTVFKTPPRILWVFGH